MTKIQNDLDICKADTADAEPDYIVIHSAAVVQIAPWDDWAKEIRDHLISHDWVPRRLGRSLHMMHRMFAGGVA